MKIDTLPNGRYAVPEDEDKIPNKVVKKSVSVKESVTLKLLALITAWSLFQLFFTQYIGIETGSKEWIKIFVLDSQNPTYYWTYITSILSHGSIFHLFINMFVFLSFGKFIELELSTKEYIGFLLLTGLAAGISQVIVAQLFIPDGMQLVGFSGALSGIIGYISVRSNVPVMLLFLIKVQIQTAVAIFILTSLFIIIYFEPGAFRIAHTSHLGGLFTGILYGLYKNRTIRSKLGSRLIKNN